jgi:DHA1 family bicyclomycin/chloramphenicol resistance-like MFS transporter
MDASPSSAAVKAELAGASPADKPPLRLFLLLIAISAIGPLSLNIVMPALPGIAAALRTDFATVQLILSFYLICMAGAQLALGPLSDRFGRRTVLIGGLVLAVVTSFGAMLAATISTLVVARGLQAFGASAGIVIGRAIIRDLYQRDQAASMIGWVTMVIMVVPMIVPWLGGVLQASLGWEAIFASIGLFCTVVLAAVVIALPETLKVRAGAGGVRRFIEELRLLLTSRRFAGYALCCATGSALFFGFLGGAPHVVITQMGRSSVELGIWFATGAAGYMVGNFISAKWSPRVGVDPMVTWGVAIGALGAISVVALVGFFPDAGPITIFLPQFITALANGLLLPNSIAGAISIRPQAAGTAAGITGFLQMAVGAAAAQTVSHFLEPAATAMPMAIIIAGFAAACSLCYLGLIRR